MSKWKDKIIKVLGGYTEPLRSEPALFVTHKKMNTVKLSSEISIPKYCEPGVEIEKHLAELLAEKIKKYMYIETSTDPLYDKYRGIIEVVVREGGGTDG